MAKKKNHSNANEKENNGGNVTVILKIDLHCEGCAEKVVKAIRSLNGVEKVNIGDNDKLKKITVIGKLDPDKLRGTVEEKIKKKVELLSPVTKKQNDGGDGEHKKQQPVVVKDENKPKKIPVTTTVLKVSLHCQGCIDKIKKLVRKTEGFVHMSIDKSKDLVTVKGGMDVNVLTTALKDRLKRKVEIVHPKDGSNEGGGGKRKGGGDGDGEEKESSGEGRGVEVHKMEYFPSQGQYTYPQYVNGPEYSFTYMHATQMFNDENPNACAIM